MDPCYSHNDLFFVFLFVKTLVPGGTNGAILSLKFPNMFVQADILGFVLNAHIILKLDVA